MSLHVIDQILYSGQQLIKLAFPTVCGLQNPMLSQTLTFDFQRGDSFKSLTVEQATGSVCQLLGVMWTASMCMTACKGHQNRLEMTLKSNCLPDLYQESNNSSCYSQSQATAD